jgi:hypothetical protein
MHSRTSSELKSDLRRSLFDRVMPRSQTKSMNAPGNPASSPELAALILRSRAVGLLEVFCFHLCVSCAGVLIGCSPDESTYPPNRQMTIAIAKIEIAVMAFLIANRCEGW